MMLANHRRQRTTVHGPRTTDQRRRGVTLVEMLVTVAVLVIMMTILVQIFQAATGSVSAAQAFQQLDDQLRRLDGILRADLEGVTARFTPPLDPALNLGYFEYGEHEFADNQGEDGDDYIRFTSKAPVGKPFTGRFWVQYFNTPNGGGGFKNLANQPLPITIQSDYAEIIYFVRNGNLYRRVLLVAPEMQPVLSVNGVPQPINNQINGAFAYFPSVFGGSIPVSWQGVNDLSARPPETGNSSTSVMLNTLGDLTNRERRFAYPRFGNDFQTLSFGGGFTRNTPDGIPDDTNGDNVPDLYPTLYPNLVAGNATSPALINTPGYRPTQANQLMAFPFVFPGAYSRAQAVSTDAYGWIHAPSPVAASSGTEVHFDTSPWLYLNALNHNPLDLGDNLPTPVIPVRMTGIHFAQTWWGFPTWRETMTSTWNDPTVPLFHVASGAATLWAGGQPHGLSYAPLDLTRGIVLPNDPNLLPPMVDPGNYPVPFSTIRPSQQLFCDGAGVQSAFWIGPNANNLPGLWQLTWEDDLIMTGVRSFDVKAYDVALNNYADLGWGDDLREYIPYSTNPGGANVVGAISVNAYAANGNTYTYQSQDLINNPPMPPPFLAGTSSTFNWPPVPQSAAGRGPRTTVWDTLNQTFAHEGRMPPLITDNRLDSQYGAATNYLPANSNFLVANGGTYNNGNIGDITPGIVRLRRVWDSWSTDYSRAPGTGVTQGGFPVGPPFSPPVYPSYPPPYPAPLRGIQIQIRAADPTNQRIKSLTIRQDFTDKL